MSDDKSIVSYEFHHVTIPSEEYLREVIQDYFWMKEDSGCPISKRKLGKEAGITDRQLRRWLNGENSIHYSKLEKLINYLITLDEG